MRRSGRVNSHSRVLLEWADGTGARQSVEGKTRIISFYGCLLVAERQLELGQSVQVTNLANKRSLGAKVVWKGGAVAGGWEMGIELSGPDDEYWGLDL